MRKLHRWVGLAVALLLLLTALTGFALTWMRPLERLMEPTLHGGHGSLGSVQALVDRIEQRFGTDAKVTLRLPQLAGQPVGAEVSSARWKGELILSPDAAQILQETEAFSTLRSVLFDLHSELMLGQFGKATLTAGSALFASLFISGITVWWPRSVRAWSGVFRLRLKSPARMWLADLHRGLGALLGWLVLLSVASGAYMAWRPISHGVSALLGEERVLPPKLPSSFKRNVDERDAFVRESSASDRRTSASFDAMVARTHLELPGGSIIYITYSGNDSPVRIRKRLDGDPHPNGLSSVWLDPITGSVLKTVVWTHLDVGARAFAWIYPFHSGQLWGAPHAWLTAFMGLALGAFVLSGVAMWWKRRSEKIPKRRRSRADFGDQSKTTG